VEGSLLVWFQYCFLEEPNWRVFNYLLRKSYQNLFKDLKAGMWLSFFEEFEIVRFSIYHFSWQSKISQIILFDF